MSDMNQPLVEMFDLLSREELNLLAQITQERDAIERFRISIDLKNVRIILADITSKLLSVSESSYRQTSSHLYSCLLSSPR